MVENDDGIARPTQYLVGRRPLLGVAAGLIVAASLPPRAAWAQGDEETPYDSASGLVPPGYRLAWYDEFDGTDLDLTEWRYRLGAKSISVNRAENVSVRNSCLEIALKKEDFAGMHYTCGGVVTRRWLGYGYYETRAKLWGDSGFHSSFWLKGLASYQPTHPAYTEPYNIVNEIDGFEVDSITPDRVTHHSYWYLPQVSKNGSSAYQEIDTSDGFHVYGFEWTPRELHYYVDGVRTFTVAYPGPHGLQNLWLTALGYKGPVDERNLPGATLFDYVRYYAPVEAGADTSPDSVVVDVDDRRYRESGDWHEARDAYGFQSKRTRLTDQQGATATWWPELPNSAGTYEVSVWNPSVVGSGDARALFTVIHDGGSTNVRVDQTTAGQGWVSLGVYPMVAGASHGLRAVQTVTGSGSLRLSAARFQPATVVDVDAHGYSETGSWRTSNNLVGWRGGATRWTVDPVATARWTPTIAHSQTFDVYVWMPASDSSAEHAYLVRHAAGTANIVPGLQAGRDRWVRLGNFHLAAGTANSVEVRRVSGEGVLRASAAKLVAAPRRRTPPPPPPAGVTGTSWQEPVEGNAVIRWRWQAIRHQHVVGYHAYLDGRRITWNPVAGDKFELEQVWPGRCYELTATAVDRWGRESGQSRPFVVSVAPDHRAPAPPSGLELEATNEGIAAYWTHNSELDRSGYLVSVDGVRTSDEPIYQMDMNNPGWTAGGYAITGLRNDHSYTVGVTAVDASGNESRPAIGRCTPTFMYVVGTDDKAYAESRQWTSSGVPGWMGSPTRTSNDPDARATWQTRIVAGGQYSVWAWVPNHSNSTVDAQFDITHAAGRTIRHIDQTRGGNQWVSLGTFAFTAGQPTSVVVSNAARKGYLRTNFVRWVPHHA